MTPLHVVAETGGQLIIVNYLIDQRADINIKNNKRVNICEYMLWTVCLFFCLKGEFVGF